MYILKKIILPLFFLCALFGITSPVFSENPPDQADAAAADAAVAEQDAAQAEAEAQAAADAAAANPDVPEAGVGADAAAQAAAQAAANAAAAQAAAQAAALAADADAVSSTGPALDSRTVPEGYQKGRNTGLPGILPDCAFAAYGCIGRDANINIFIRLGINIARFAFALIGTVAFVMFVYGGFTMILSFGTADRFKKGRDILVAAVVGMIIAFGAYILVDFILDVLQVGSDFRIVK